LFRFDDSDSSKPPDVGNDREVPVIQVAQQVRRRFPGVPIVQRAATPRDSRQRRTDLASKDRGLPGWSCPASCEEGAMRTIDGFRAEPKLARAPAPPEMADVREPARLSVLVLAGGDADGLAVTLASLQRQTTRDWRAWVLGGADVGATAGARPADGTLHGVRAAADGPVPVDPAVSHLVWGAGTAERECLAAPVGGRSPRAGEGTGVAAGAGRDAERRAGALADARPGAGTEAVAGAQTAARATGDPGAGPCGAPEAPVLVLRAGQALAADVLEAALRRAAHGRGLAWRAPEPDTARLARGAPLDLAELRIFEPAGPAATAAAACWLAAAEAGAGRDGRALVAACAPAAPPAPDVEIDPEPLARALVEGLALGAGRPEAQLLAHWEAFWPRLRQALEALESAWRRPGLARRLVVRLERRLLPARLEGRTALAYTLALPVDPAALSAIDPAPGCDTLLLEFVDANLALRRLERPLWGRVAAHELAAILEEQLGAEELMRRGRFERHAEARRIYRYALLRSTVRALPDRLSLDARRRAFAGPHLTGNLHWSVMHWLRRQEPAASALGSARAAAIVAASGAGAPSAGAAPAASEHDVRRAMARLERAAADGGLAAVERPAATTATDGAAPRPVDHLPVLAYGRIVEDGAGPSHGDVPAARFEAQLALLRQHGWHALPLDALLTRRRGDEPLEGRPVLLSFDGGLDNFLSHAWPRLQRHGFGAHVFATPEELPRDTAGRERLRALAAAGVGFGLRLPSGRPADAFGSEALLRWTAGALAALRETLGTAAASVALGDSCGPREWSVVAQAGCALLFQGEGRSVYWDRERPLRRLRVHGDWTDARFARALRLAPAELLVSVIVPAYNAAATIDATLESVRGQSYRHLEVLVIDDGSTDDTAARVERHAAADPRVRLLRQPNAGVAAARNRGLRAASGAYVAPVDADDLWHPHKIERQVRMFEHGPPSLGLVYTWYAVIDAEGRVMRGTSPSLQGDVQLDLMRLGNFVGNASSALIRRELALRFGYDTSLRERGAQGCEDYKLYLQLAGESAFAVVPDLLTGYRVVDGNMSSAILTMRRSCAQVLEEFAARDPVHAALLGRGQTLMLAWLANRGIECGRLEDAKIIAGELEPLDAPRARSLRRRAWRAALKRFVLRWAWGRALRTALAVAEPPRPPFPIGRPA